MAAVTENFVEIGKPRGTEEMSPEYMQLSLAAAITLGIRGGKFMNDAYTRCLNLLMTYPRGCAANCSYCGLARDRQGVQSDKSFIRVEWPTVRMEEIIDRAKTKTDVFERMCISMITHKNSDEDTMTILEQWMREDCLHKIPVSILSNPTTMSKKDLIALRNAGAERFTVALDAVTEDLFDATRGRGVKGPNRWQQYWKIYEESYEVFGRDKIGIHVICGMGETEKEIVETMFRARALGEYGSLQLFAFNPEEGSRLENLERVPLGQFRRVQLSRYIIDKGYVQKGDIKFNEDQQIVDFGLSEDKVEELVALGTPFRTSGCPGKECDVSACNRPYGDGPPSDFSSFPFALRQFDVDNVRVQMKDFDGSITRAMVKDRTLHEIEALSMHPCRG